MDPMGNALTGGLSIDLDGFFTLNYQALGQETIIFTNLKMPHKNEVAKIPKIGLNSKYIMFLFHEFWWWCKTKLFQWSKFWARFSYTSKDFNRSKNKESLWKNSPKDLLDLLPNGGLMVT